MQNNQFAHKDTHTQIFASECATSRIKIGNKERTLVDHELIPTNFKANSNTKPMREQMTEAATAFAI